MPSNSPGFLMANDPKITIYCYDHTNSIRINNGWIKPIYSAQTNPDIPSDIISDGTGENISALGKFFSELTGQYWVMKNDKTSDYIGFCHYRRFFNFLPHGAWPAPIISTKKNATSLAFLADDRQLAQIKRELRISDIIVPRALHLPLSIREQYCKSHDAQKFDSLTEILSKKPSYRESLEYFDISRKFYFYNMYVGHRKVIIEYLEELFNVLFELVDQHSLNAIEFSGNRYEEYRFPGYLSERFLMIYIHARKLRLTESQVVFLSESN